LSRGDNDLLSFLVRLMERHGITIVGAHEILPDHVAPFGRAGVKGVSERQSTLAADAIKAALAIGRLDIGQGVVAIGRRIVAVEGAEGTDAMLARIAELRLLGRVHATEPAILAKLAKPEQELRADMPTIGPKTIEGAKAANIAQIYLSANAALIMEAGRTIAAADAAGIAIIGVDAKAFQ
jgi:UDP-2,3-diacylglucosamine hydrolase